MQYMYRCELPELDEKTGMMTATMQYMYTKQKSKTT